MSQSPSRGQILINDGSGNKSPIGTGVFVSPAYDIQEKRRLSFTIGVQGSTGVAGGGFTGTLQVQTTNETANCNGGTGTQAAGSLGQPGNNGYTGALFWQTVQSGTIAVTNAMNVAQVDINDVNAAYFRVAFNMSATGAINTAVGAGGSGTMFIYWTGKNA